MFHAEWGYVITLDKTGGETDGKAGVIANGTELNVTAAPVKAGYVVMSYFTDRDCTTKIAGADKKLIADVDGLTDADGKWIATSGQTFYVQWGKNLGGLVYYADKANGAAATCYKFYDKDGNKLTVDELEYGVSFYTDDTKTIKATAVYYDDAGKSAEAKDRYYVVNNTMDMTKTYTWTYKDASGSFVTTDELCIGAGSIGKGRSNTKTVMEYNGGAYVTNANSNPTIWYMLDKLNAGSSLAMTNNGCSDWFVPSLNELCELAKLVNTKAWTDLAYQEGDAPYVSSTDYPEWATLVTALKSTSAWSSTGFSAATSADVWNTNTGKGDNRGKGNPLRLVAVRAF